MMSTWIEDWRVRMGAFHKVYTIGFGIEYLNVTLLSDSRRRARCKDEKTQDGRSVFEFHVAVRCCSLLVIL